MGDYSIKDLEVLSGIKAHTLRIWEQRYNLISPGRTDTNIRKYTGEDLRLLLNISLLNQNGHKISKIAEMSVDQIYREVLILTESNLRYPDQIKALTMAMVDIDEARFEKIMSRSILQLGIENTMIHIIYPFLSRIGIMWQTGTISPAQEHFMSNLIRQKLIVAIDGVYNTAPDGEKKYLLFLAEEELHELSLLFAHYLIKSRQKKSVYFGQSLPFSDLINICKSHNPDFLVTILTSFPSISETQQYINKLSEAFISSKIILSGNRIMEADLEVPDNVIILNQVEDFIALLEKK